MSFFPMYSFPGIFTVGFTPWAFLRGLKGWPKDVVSG